MAERDASGRRSLDQVGPAACGRWLEREDLAVLVALGIAALLLLVTGLGSGSLAWWDEGLSAERAREMLRRPAWFTQEAGAVILNKPPGYYGMAAVSLWAQGLTIFAVRLPSALFGALTVVAVFAVLRRLGEGRPTALVGALLLLGNPHWLQVSREARLESATGAAILLGLCLFVRPGAGPRSCFAAGLVAGLGALVKNPLTLAALVAARPWRHGARGLLLLLAGFMVGGGWWYALAWAQQTELFTDHFVRFNAVERLLRPVEGHQEGLSYYHRSLAKRALVPYLVLVASVVWFVRRGTLPPRIAPFLWFVVGWLVLLHVAQSRLDWYLVPAYPAFAVVGGVGLVGILRAVTPRLRGVLAVALGGFLLWMLFVDKRGWRPVLDGAPAARQFAARLEPLLGSEDRLLRLGGPGHLYAFYMDRYVLVDEPLPEHRPLVILAAPQRQPAPPAQVYAEELARGDGLSAVRWSRR